MNPDVVIIGGGIVGCACAYYLAQAGLRTHLIDRGPIGSGASRAGMMHVVTWEEPEIHLKLASASKLLYEELSQTLPMDIQYRRTGSIAIIENEAGVAAFTSSVQHLQEWGLNCRMLSAADLREMEPNISPDVAGGAFFEDDAQVNPLYTTLALAQAARSLGAVIEPFRGVTGFETNPAKNAVSAVLTTKGRIPTRNVVIAAGAWSSEVGKLAGLEIPIQPRKGTLIVTATVPDDFMRCKVILAAGYMDSVRSGAGSGISVAANIQQAQNGNLVLGTSRQLVGFEGEVDLHVVGLVLARCLRFFPGLAQLPVLRTWSGFRPYTPDNIPIISVVETLDGVYIAAGHEGIGITEGPITGKLISQILTGQPPAVPLDPLKFSRFEAIHSVRQET